MEVVDQRIPDCRQNDERRARDQHEQPERCGHPHVDLGEPLDALVQAGDHGDQRDADDDQDQHDLGRVPGRHAEQVVQAAGDLLGAETQRHREPEERREDSDHVDEMPEGPPHALAEHGIECRSQGQRHAAVEAEKRQRQPDDGVDRPGVQSPVKYGRRHADRPRRPGIRRVAANRRIDRVRNGFQHAEEHQADADAGRKQHRQPAGIAIAGNGVRPAQPDATEP